MNDPSKFSAPVFTAIDLTNIPNIKLGAHSLRQTRHSIYFVYNLKDRVKYEN